MSKIPVASLVPVPTTVPAESWTLICTSGTAVGGFSRLSWRQPVMWMVSSLRGGGRTQVCEEAVVTGDAEAGTAPRLMRALTTMPSSTTINARVLLGRACMGLLSPRRSPLLRQDYNHGGSLRCLGKMNRPSVVPVPTGHIRAPGAHAGCWSGHE